MAKRPPNGLSIEDAFRRYADPALLVRLDELEPHANGFTEGVTEHLHNEYQGLHDAIAQSLIRRLQRGELIARGLVRGAPVAQGKVDVDPDWWAELGICFELDEIVGHGVVLTAVEIREAEPDAADEHHGLAATTKQADRDFEHDPDYRWVRLRGVTFKLGPQQAHVVRRLHAASRTDEPWVHGKELLRHKSAIESLSIRDLFKSKPNWRVLIDSDGRGLYRLNLP